MKKATSAALAIVGFFLFFRVGQAAADQVSAELDRVEGNAVPYSEYSDYKASAVNTALDRFEAESPSENQSFSTPPVSDSVPIEPVYYDETLFRQAPPIEYDKNGPVDPWGERGKEEVLSKQLETGLIQTRFDVYTGYRDDTLNWNIAGMSDGTSPNILSELSWDNLHIWQIEGAGRVTFAKRLRLEGSLGYGWIYKGDNQDSDYFGDNRTLEFSRSNNNSDGDNVYDWSVGGGYQYNLGEMADLMVDELWMTFLGGYSHHEQNVRITDGFQTIPAAGPFDGLNSTYKARWQGPWMGLELRGAKGKIFGFARFEYHWADYYGKGDWNLRDDFQHPVSFTHDAHGLGTVISLGAGYILSRDWTLQLRADIENWDTDYGTDRTYFSSGATAETMLNVVNWESLAIMLGATYRFSR